MAEIYSYTKTGVKTKQLKCEISQTPAITSTYLGALYNTPNLDLYFDSTLTISELNTLSAVVSATPNYSIMCPVTVPASNQTGNSFVYTVCGDSKVFTFSGSDVVFEGDATFEGLVNMCNSGTTLLVNNISGCSGQISVSGDIDMNNNTITNVNFGDDTLCGKKNRDGFLNRTDSTISFVNSSRTFTITPVATSFDFYHENVCYNKTSPESVVIGDVEGVWFIYYDDGTLTTSQTPWNLSTQVPVSLVHWNAVSGENIIFAEERHALMPWETHQYLHNTFGARYVNGLDISGYTINGKSLSGQVTIGITSGAIRDEDIQINITDSASPTGFFEQKLSEPAQIPVYYRDGANGDWRKDDATDYWVKNTPGGRVNFNEFTGGAWQQTEATAKYYVAYWIFATDNIYEPIIVIQGQRQDEKLEDAENNNDVSSIDFGTLPAQEMKPLYEIIVRTYQNYDTGRQFKIKCVQDLRGTGLTTVGTFVNADHNSLQGRNIFGAHNAAAIAVNTNNLSGLLVPASAYDDVQAVINNLDTHTHPQITEITTVSGDWDSTYTTVNSTSANWGSAYTHSTGDGSDHADVAANTADITNIASASGDWESTHTTVQSSSGSWGGASATYDRQMAHQTSLTTTTNNTYQDLPGMTLTTNNLGEGGTYVINFTCEWNASSTQDRCLFNLVIDGTQVLERTLVTPDKVTSSGENASFSISYITTGLTSGKIIKIQWKETEGTTFRCGDRTLTIDGVPDSQVV